LLVFWINKARGIARHVKAFLIPAGDAARVARQAVEQHEQNRAENPKDARGDTSEYREKIKSKRRELSKTKREHQAASGRAERSAHKKKKKETQQEIFELERELRATKEWAEKRRRQRQKLKNKRQELKQIGSQQVELKQMRKGLGAVQGWTESIKLRRKKNRVQQEIFALERELRATEEWAEGKELVTGALPDFVIIGARKAGTSYLYYLLSQHPLVERASAKELHFFDLLFEQEDVEWYRQCFPAPKWKDGRRTITGEATPYMASHRVPQRVAKVVPQARLIALLRNPVDRAYSDYQQGVRKGRETRSFEEAVGLKKARSVGREEETPEAEVRPALEDNSEYISRSIYVDQLQYWSKFFDKKQLLVLKSEEFFERPKETLKVVLAFLDLPEWEPQGLEPRDEPNKEKYERTKVNKGRYEQEMDPATRSRLEEYFEAHNRRLYDYLGVDFAW